MESDETKDGSVLASVFWCCAGFGFCGSKGLFAGVVNVEYCMMGPHLDKERSRSRF